MRQKFNDNVLAEPDLRRPSVELSCVYRANLSPANGLAMACGHDQNPSSCTDASDSFACAVLDALPQQIPASRDAALRL